MALLGSLLLVTAAIAAAPLPLTADGYRESVAPITDCAALEKGWQILPDARPLLRTLFDAEPPAKRKNETDETFLDRAVQQLFERLGDPSRIYLRVNLAGATRYDPSRGAMIVRLPDPFEAVLDRWGRTQLRIGGAVPLVTQNELRARLDFPGSAGGDIALPMTPAEAARFAQAGRLQILALFEDLGTEASHRSAATPGSAAVQTSYKLVQLQPKCAFITNGPATVAGWSFNGWSDPPTAG